MSENERVTFRQRLNYHSVLLGGMALLATAILATAHFYTKDEIVARLEDDTKASLSQVVPAELYDNDLLKDTLLLAPPNTPATEKKLIYRARKKGEIVAVAYQMMGQGFSGPIQLIMGVDRKGTVLGVRIVSHAETPGLGDKIEAKKSNWILSFTGHSLANPGEDRWKVKKDGGIFDQFSGATITPRAVVKIVELGLELFNANRTELLGLGIDSDDKKDTMNSEGGNTHGK